MENGDGGWIPGLWASRWSWLQLGWPVWSGPPVRRTQLPVKGPGPLWCPGVAGNTLSAFLKSPLGEEERPECAASLPSPLGDGSHTLGHSPRLGACCQLHVRMDQDSRDHHPVG